tara:strand:+ start:844 stop:1014 length:171 start_codon:yes stop_codon:yes gene_type:complete
MITMFKIALTVFWICTTLFLIGWLAYEWIYAPLVDEDNNIIENLKKMNERDEREKK